MNGKLIYSVSSDDAILNLWEVEEGYEVVLSTEEGVKTLLMTSDISEAIVIFREGALYILPEIY